MKKIKTKLLLLSMMSCFAQALAAAAATASVLLVASKCKEKDSALQKAAQAFKCAGIKKSA